MTTSLYMLRAGTKICIIYHGIKSYKWFNKLIILKVAF